MFDTQTGLPPTGKWGFCYGLGKVVLFLLTHVFGVGTKTGKLVVAATKQPADRGASTKGVAGTSLDPWCNLALLLMAEAKRQWRLWPKAWRRLSHDSCTM